MLLIWVSALNHDQNLSWNNLGLARSLTTPGHCSRMQILAIIFFTGFNLFPFVVGTESSLSPKQKEHRTWKGKVVRTFKRHSSSSAVVTSDPPSQPEEITGTFGVPLECCCPSLMNEVITAFCYNIFQKVLCCFSLLRLQSIRNLKYDEKKFGLFLFFFGFLCFVFF